MTYQAQAKNIVDRFLAITNSHTKARDCALLYIEICLEEVEKEIITSPYLKIRAHELKKIKQHI